MSSAIKNLVVGSGVLKWSARLRPARLAILMYHSVLERPESEFHTLGAIMHSVAVFRGQMEVLARDFHPVSLDDALLFTRGEKDLAGRPVVVTFDDGYSDNLEIAIPILNHFGIPATIYVVVDSVNTRKLPWPSRLRFAMYTTTVRSWISSDGTAYGLDTPEDRDRAFLRACDECCQLAGAAQEHYVQKVERELQASIPPDKSPLMMTWEQVRSVVKAGHTVGSHTMSHPNMAYISESEGRRELQESKQQLEAELGQAVVHFSYPCPAMSPHWTRRTILQTRQLGYQTAVTTDPGVIQRQDDPLSLHRLRPSKTIDGLRWNLESAFAGRV